MRLRVDIFNLNYWINRRLLKEIKIIPLNYFDWVNRRFLIEKCHFHICKLPPLGFHAMFTKISWLIRIVWKSFQMKVLVKLLLCFAMFFVCLKNFCTLISVINEWKSSFSLNYKNANLFEAYLSIFKSMLFTFMTKTVFVCFRIYNLMILRALISLKI